MSNIVRREARGWALITGASSGLGVEFARQLAARGYNVILTARRRDRLEKLADEVSAKHAAQTWVIEADLGAPDAVTKLVRELDARGVVPNVLVNNAGFGMHCAAIEAPIARTMAMIQLNVAALTELTITIGAKMAARGSGGILNVASTAAFQPTPWFASYGATKAYVATFSQAISRELAPRGVRVCALCPGPTKTEFFEAGEVKIDLNEALVMSAERCVGIGLRALERGRSVVVSGWMNAIVAWISRISPLWLVSHASGRMMRPRRESHALPSPK